MYIYNMNRLTSAEYIEIREAGKKRCPKCNKIKLLNEFYKNATTSTGYTGQCKNCNNILRKAYFKAYRKTPEAKTKHNKRQREYYYRKKNKEEIKEKEVTTWKEISLLQKYDMTLDHWNMLYKRQKGRCAICKAIPERGLCVDHNHKTGHNRGLLCHNCNAGIGFLQDSPKILKSALAYLSK